MTGSAFHAVAPVSAVCAAFRTQPGAYPPKAPKPDVAPPCGSFGESGKHGANNRGKQPLRPEHQKGKNREILNAAARKRRESGEKAGQSRGVVRAPQRSHLPAVRAVSGICEGVPKATKNSPRALQYEKSPSFQGKRRGSDEKYEVNTEKW